MLRGQRSPLMARHWRYTARITLDVIDAKIDSVAALSDAARVWLSVPWPDRTVLFVIMVVDVLRGRFLLPKLILTFGGILPAAMMLTGAVPWQNSGSPGLVVSLVVAAWSVTLTALALFVGRLAEVPNIIAAAALALLRSPLTPHWVPSCSRAR